MTYILFATAFSLSSIAAYYAVIGLIAIFPAAPIPIAIMGSVLEVAKIVTASWLQKNWNNISFILKTYFILAITTLMLLTSMGIYGFLSKAHGNQSINVSENTIKVQNLDRQIAVEKSKINDSEKIIAQLDSSVQILLDANRLRGKDGAIAIRNSQTEERSKLKTVIDTSYQKINEFESVKVKLLSEKALLDAEVGPLKYVAALIYGDSLNDSLLESTVRGMILLIIFVFDPLAVLLFVALSKTSTKQESIINQSKIDPELVSTIDSEKYYTKEENLNFSNDEKSYELKFEDQISTDDRGMVVEKLDSQTKEHLKFDFK